MKLHLGALNEKPTYPVWRSLANATLARILCFNKRRASEPAKMVITKFLERPSWESASGELVESLGLLEKQLMRK
jgi:hypothetical protein